MPFADIHIHVLYGVDDGAETEAEMHAMVDAAYADGVRIICATPHFHPGYFGNHNDQIEAAFQALTDYARQRYPQMEFCLGNELRYSCDCVSWLQSGQCRTLNGTQYVLVDFSDEEEQQRISDGLDQLLNAGYRPVLAHVERYRTLFGQLKMIRTFQDNGVLLQVDAQALLGNFGFMIRRQSKAMLSAGLIDLIGSDGHDLVHRPPELSKCFQYIQKKCGTDYAEALCWNNALRLLHDDSAREGLD